MKKILFYLRKRLQKEEFNPSFLLGMAINPNYLIRRGLAKAIKKNSSKLKGDILDFGCGSKPYKSFFTKATKYIGIDKKNTGHNHDMDKRDVDIFWDGNKLPLTENSFNSIFSSDVFEHLFEPEKVLREFYRILKPNGMILLTVPFFWEEHEIPFDYARYSSYGITNLLEKNGFKVIQLEKTTSYVLAIFQLLINYIIRFIIPSNKFSRLIYIFTTFPITFLALICDYILPKKYDFYCHNVVVAKRQ